MSRSFQLKSRVVGCDRFQGRLELDNVAMAAYRLAHDMRSVSAKFAKLVGASLPFATVVANARAWHELGEGVPDLDSLDVLDRTRVAADLWEYRAGRDIMDFLHRRSERLRFPGQTKKPLRRNLPNTLI